MMYRIKTSDMTVLFDLLSEKYDLFIPQSGGDGASYFKKYESGCEYRCGTNTALSPKDLFFPQTEDLMRFKTEGKKIGLTDIRQSRGDFIIFGVRACDVKSFEVLDRVFLSEPADSIYAEKRAHGTVVSVACGKPSETCFCRTYGIDPAEPPGDVGCFICDGYLYLQPNTASGEKLTGLCAGVLEETDGTAVGAEKERIRKTLDKLPLKDLTTDGFGSGKTGELFDREEWAELSQSCLGCGTCTFVCPT